MPKNGDKAIKVIELFAGVGGFRLGLEGWLGRSATSGYKEAYTSPYKVVWGNQWEPGTKTQDAFKVYASRFGDPHANRDIQEVIEHSFHEIPDADMLVGGFPCQDYSVARTLNQATGLVGKKGVLWWSIYNILKKKSEAGAPIKYLMLENVDRLLKSPAAQRGRDFAIMLSSLAELGYAVEWRVINAADYGMPQRRRRVFFIAYYNGTNLYNELKEADGEDWLLSRGVIPDAFPVQKKTGAVRFTLEKDLLSVTEHFNADGKKSSFMNSGMMCGYNVVTMETMPSFTGVFKTIREILIDDARVPESYFIDAKSMSKWNALKGAKKLIRVNKAGFEYKYAEGGMVFPDDLDRPSRTIVTGEGGSTPSRFKHVVLSLQSDRLRRLVPLELERLNMFPDDHTAVEGASDIKRAFFMGNALVVGIVERLGVALAGRMGEGKAKASNMAEGANVSFGCLPDNY